MNAEMEACVADYYRGRLNNLRQRIEQEIADCTEPVTEILLRGLLAADSLATPESEIRRIAEQPAEGEETK